MTVLIDCAKRMGSDLNSEGTFDQSNDCGISESGGERPTSTHSSEEQPQNKHIFFGLKNVNCDVIF